MTQEMRVDDVDVAAGSPEGVDHRRFWKVLGRFAGTLVDLYELGDVLDQLGADMRCVLGVAGAGVMVGDDEGDLRVVSSSDEVLHHLDALQITLGEGPGVLAYRSGFTVLLDHPRDDRRFPRFGPLVCGAGIASVYSFPMCLEEQVVGALSLYCERPAPLTVDQIEAGRTLASVATSHLLNARDAEQRELLTSQLQHALDSRVVIEQAKGFLTARLRVPPQDAFELLRGYARRNQVTVRSIAHGLLRGDLEPKDLLRD